MQHREWLAVVLCALSSAAMAADSPVAPASPMLPTPLRWDVRVGAYAHDPASPERSGPDLNAQLVSPALYQFRASMLSGLTLHAYLSTTINFSGKTSFGAGGLAARYAVTERVFVEGSLGGAFHNGETHVRHTRHHNEMGCNAAFHESASLGYRFTETWSVLATVEHISNAGACSQNRGVTNFGARVGYSF